jgi:arsenite methyltransferase
MWSSNCVVNLSTDRAAVFAEALRVLKPGGWLGVTDVVAEDRLSAVDRAERGAWVGCIADAPSRSEPEAGLAQAGFTGVSVAFTHPVGDGLHSAIVKASKPAAASRRPPPCRPATNSQSSSSPAADLAVGLGEVGAAGDGWTTSKCAVGWWWFHQRS